MNSRERQLAHIVCAAFTLVTASAGCGGGAGSSRDVLPNAASASSGASTPLPTATPVAAIVTAPPVITGASIAVASGDAAWAFTDSVGMNVHTNSGYPRYSQNQAYAVALLRAAQIRHARGYDLQFGPADATSIAFVNAMASAGIRSSAGMTSAFNARTPETPSYLSSAIAVLQPGAVEALEGPNELDTCCGDANWAADDRSSMQTLAKATSTQANLAGLPIVGPSIVFADASAMGDLSTYQTYNNTHIYYAGFMPENTGYGGPSSWSNGYRYGSLSYNLANTLQNCASCRTMVTETGYSTVPNTRNSVPEDVEAAWITRLLLNHWAGGVPRTYLYELMAYDTTTPDGTLGLIRPDLTPKPAFKALAGMMQILADTQHAGSCARPVTIGGAIANVRAVELCKASGEVDLVVWIAAQGYDTNAFAYTPVAPQTVVVATAPAPTSAWSYDGTGSWSANASPNLGAFVVKDYPQIITLGGPKPTPLPALPVP